MIAARFVDGVVAKCDSLGGFASRGTRRDDIRPGLRILTHRRRTAIIFTVGGDRVMIVGICYGGQDYGAALKRE